MKTAVDLLALGLWYALGLYPKWRTAGTRILAVNTVMYVYLCGVLYVTLMPVLAALPFLFDHAYGPMAMMPFNDLIHGWGDAERQILLNVIMTVPFGFLLPVCRVCGGKPWGFWRCTAATAVLSASIELVQPLLHSWRAADITDIITNTLGGVLGYLLYLLVRWAWRRRK